MYGGLWTSFLFFQTVALGLFCVSCNYWESWLSLEQGLFKCENRLEFSLIKLFSIRDFYYLFLLRPGQPLSFVACGPSPHQPVTNSCANQTVVLDICRRRHSSSSLQKHIEVVILTVWSFPKTASCRSVNRTGWGAAAVLGVSHRECFPLWID